MTQDIRYMPSCLKTPAKSSANSPSACHEDFCSVLDTSDVEVLQQRMRAAELNVKFLQNEHSHMLIALHGEIDRLQQLCRDLQFKCEVGGCLLPDSEFFKCSPKTLEEKVNDLLHENVSLKHKLSESHQAIDILDQKEKLALWQHTQELEQRDNIILQLEQEMESKCNALAELSAQQEARRKKGGILRRLSFLSSNHPSAVSAHPPVTKVRERRVDHLSREDLPTEIQNSLRQETHSSYSSLSSDRSMSDDEGFAQRCYIEGERLPNSKVTCVKLPPISNLPLVSSSKQLVRSQLRVHCLPNEQIPHPDISIKRLNKA